MRYAERISRQFSTLIKEILLDYFSLIQAFNVIASFFFAESQIGEDSDCKGNQRSSFCGEEASR